ncbi:hypothetical protein J6590_008266 [Homalodisca vitripennis]|nr:hypothetical protein J6590_008266 [Homalodisca vitripennis]
MYQQILGFDISSPRGDGRHYCDFRRRYTFINPPQLSHKVASLVQYNGYSELSEEEPVDLPSCVYASRNMLSPANCSHLPAYLSLTTQGKWCTYDSCVGYHVVVVLKAS